MKTIKIRLLELFIGKVDDSVKRGFWLVSELVNQHRLFLLLLLAVGVFVGLIEGAAIGLLAFSIAVITGETTKCLDGIESLSKYLPIDLCHEYNKYDMFVTIVVISIFVQIAKSLITYVSTYLGVVLSTRISYQMQSRVFTHMMNLSYQDSNSYSVAEKTALVSYSKVISKIAIVVNNLISVCFVLATYFIILILMNWKLTIFSFILLAGLVLFLIPFLEKISNLARKQRDERVLLSRKMIDYLFAVRVIKLYERTSEVINSTQQILSKLVGMQRRMVLLKEAVPNLQESILVVSVSILLLVSFSLAGENAESVLPQILAYILVLHRCNGKVVSFNSIRTSISDSIAPLERISDFLSFESERIDISSTKKISNGWKKLSIKNLSFSYADDNQAVLKDIDIDIVRNQSIAFVGQSGSGKSTLVDIIVGLLYPKKGNVQFDGVSSTQITSREWVSQFSMVSQNDLILDGTVLDNLLFACPDATKEQIIHACKVADAHDFIQKLDDGYNTLMGERGYKVSGGQMQRIAFARAVLKPAPIMILDEATSALDTISEQKIVDSLKQEFGKCTLIFIAHRLSTVVDVDQIYVIDDGQVADYGTHFELLQKEGIYSDMWKLQNNQR